MTHSKRITNVSIGRARTTWNFGHFLARSKTCGQWKWKRQVRGKIEVIRGTWTLMAEQCRSECWWVEDTEWSRAGHLWDGKKDSWAREEVWGLGNISISISMVIKAVPITEHPHARLPWTRPHLILTSGLWSVGVVSPIYQWGAWGSERLNHLSRVRASQLPCLDLNSSCPSPQLLSLPLGEKLPYAIKTEKKPKLCCNRL